MPICGLEKPVSTKYIDMICLVWCRPIASYLVPPVSAHLILSVINDGL